MNLTTFSNHKQLFLDLNLSIPFEVTDNEAALMILLQNQDYSHFFPLKKKTGRPRAADPYTMMLILLYARTQGKFSSRDVERLCKRDIFLLKILGERKAPDHTTFDRFIRTHEKAIDKLFFHVVARLAELGELKKDVVYQDGTKIESKAGRYTFVWKKALSKNLEILKKHIDTLITEVCSQYSWTIDTELPISALETIKKKLESTGEELIPEKIGRGHRVTNIQKYYRDTLIYLEKLKQYESYFSAMNGRNSMSKTDPDATFMRMKDDHMRNGQLKPAYNLQVLVDGGYIVGAHASADRTDYATMIPALAHMHEHIPWKYTSYCADSGYDCQQNHEVLKKQKIDAYIKPLNYEQSKKRKSKKDIGKKENMTYDLENDQFICTKGKKLKSKNVSSRKNQYGYTTETHIYRCERGCKNCKLRSACMKKSKAPYKQVQINHKLERYHKEALTLINSDRGKEIRVNRSIQAEGAFAQIKANWSFRRFLKSGMNGIYTEWLLMCFAMNIIHLGNRLAKDEVGNPFYYRILEESA